MKLLPIMRTSVIYRSVNRGVVCSGSKSLIGIVVVSPKRKYAIDVDGEEVPVELYVEQSPQVKELLENMQ